MAAPRMFEPRRGCYNDRQTDGMFWYNNTICIIVQYKVKSGNEEAGSSSSANVHLSLTNCLSSSEGVRGWRRETHHRCSRCSSARSWTGTRRQQIITSTTATSPGGTAKEDNINSNVEEDITTTSCRIHRRSWQVRYVKSMIGSEEDMSGRN